MSKAPLITINGYVLNSRFRISELKRPFPQARVVTETVPGMDGEIITEKTIGPRYVSFRVWSFSMDHSKLLEDMAEIASLLLETKEELVLSISDENGRVRNVVLDGDLDFDEYEERGTMPIKLKQPDPYCDINYSYEATVPSGGSVSVSIQRSLSSLVITATAACRNSSSLVWGVRFDEGDYLHVKLPNASEHSVAIDCMERSVKVDGAVSMVTLDSDWPDLGRGPHVIRMDQGTGAANVMWRGRCL